MCSQKFQYLDVVRRSIYFYSKMHVSAVQLTAVSLRLHGVTNFSQPSPPPYTGLFYSQPRHKPVITHPACLVLLVVGLGLIETNLLEAMFISSVFMA